MVNNLNIRKIRASFLTITTSIECLNMLKENEEAKNTIIEKVRNACSEIENLQPSIECAMFEELKLM